MKERKTKKDKNEKTLRKVIFLFLESKKKMQGSMT